MGISSAIYASVRTNARRAYTGSASQELDINRGGDLLVSQGLPDRTSLVSMGNSWVSQTLTASAKVPVAVIPTSASDFSLYNSSTVASNISVIIDSVFFIVQTSSGAADFYSLLGQMIGPGSTAPSAHASIVSSLNGKGTTYNGVVTRAITNATGVTNAWFPIGTSQNTAALTATAGLTMDFDVYGKYIIQPTGTMLIAGMCSTGATGKLVIGVRWHEVVLDLA